MNTIKAKLVIKFPLIIIISKLNSLHVSQEMNSYFLGEFNIRSEVTLSFSPGTSSLILFSFCCLLFSPKRIPEKAPFKTQSSKTDSRKEIRIIYLQYQAQVETSILSINLFILHPDQCNR